jgi:hypothetical protein
MLKNNNLTGIQILIISFGYGLIALSLNIDLTTLFMHLRLWFYSNMLYNDVVHNPYRRNWCSLVKNLLCELGFIDAWIFQTVGDADLFLLNVKQR